MRGLPQRQFVRTHINIGYSLAAYPPAPRMSDATRLEAH